MNEFFNPELEDSRHFCRLPFELNGHRYFYKGDAPSVDETQQDKAAAEISTQKWKYYKETFQPIENQFMQKVDDLNTDGARNFATGAAASAVTSEFDNVRSNAAEGLRSAGINPNSGAYKSTMDDIGDKEASLSSDAKVRALNTVEDNYVQGLSNVSAIGRGQSTQTQYGLHDLAIGAQQNATQGAYDDFNKQSANLNAAGSLAGAAIYMGKNQGSNQNTKNTTGSANIYDDGIRRA